ncbi:hypothetical protein C343_02146 [Cryptococcus neoformans C23]|uniref:GTPase-activating protein GYP5 n=1 Tax=Cryptococcus neoformans (strain H99 / ATCC 208821 / CBS 10515 / FGSC 9487) TaxID=235443 RepID=J9VI16_CRYN9|nr:hypothetical protein CNAG_07566 [Cryptococcus neoformans var. grubii H99]AUB23684.1 hypothetical protein CKF44_07566 [Cryptococcus neoformans var. grubii]OWZ34009.1 hypothetical protein C347_02214 [Cryptococcus neoformans var. grubii AD2-60a]OWZ46137.1 hypothetical protein C343_02146 [Cryptococcus neoformans var. grubii C23]OXC85776.1 hypothetical protein C344_01946 [Cryptococcus neoformans var. grubii AD1-7a]AFR94077.2 hypothetical protein CNAG_07566 [Cryptococcus neoformans var. grubii H9|eukprot:XP_012047970.1 hypothetical protein CNAG_07566 [Cryptococcus neoformans var. grubii H99]
MATSKVKARAAMFEKGAPDAPPSFALAPRKSSAPKSPPADPAPPPSADRTERFSDVPLTDIPPSAPEIPETAGTAADPAVTQHTPLFAAIPAPHHPDTAPTLHAPAPAASPNASPGGGWKSTMSHLLTRSASSTSTSEPSRAPSPAATATATASTSTPPQSTLSPSPSPALLHRAESAPTRDRRLSKDLSVFERGREGFEKVRSEMDSAAMEMRRERQSKRASTYISLEDAPAIDTPDTIPETPEEEEVDWAFWGTVVQGYEQVALARPKELSKAIQQGVPPVIRGAVWQLMSSSKSLDLEEAYKALLKLNSPHEKAIMKDLNRTFPNHKYFKEGGGVGQEGLFMVVKAYSLYDQEVGYTQGLAFIVAALLLNMPDEEAFCVLVRLMDSYNLRSHYTAEMQGLQLRLFQFDRLVEEILPLLHTHFVRKGVKSSMYASQWFMTLFSYRFPLSLVYRVLDIVFAEGIEAVFRFSLALLKKSEEKLVQLDFEQILQFLQADLFEVYRAPAENNRGEAEDGKENGYDVEEEWKANEFVRDAFKIRITPLMLDAYASEWEEKCRDQNRHAIELDQLRNANRNLSSQVKQLEASLAAINQEHVELVRRLVMSNIEKEEMENELVRYKMLYAELAHAQQEALSVHSRLSNSSTTDTSKSTK